MLKKTVTALVLSFALTLLMVSFVAITADATDEQKAEITTHVRDVSEYHWISPISKGVVYDNGMDYDGLGASQSDPSFAFDPIIADDFTFDVEQLVNDVHWIGGYWNGPPDDGDFDWEIKFYNDFGDGTKPGALIATYYYANADVNETFIEQIGTSFYFSYSVDLPAPLSFGAGTKYWMSVQGIGAYPPQSGWAYHLDPILLHEAVFKSVYFGFPNWTNTFDVFGYSVDMCFQLTYEDPWPNHKMHFPQEPDLEGWDVYAVYPKTLADDWQCSATGWVTDIHFWGSWKDIDGDPYTDDFQTPMPFFNLSIHRNIPATPDTPWSRPGEQVWFWEGEIGGTPFDPPAMEHWFNPNTGEVLYNDHVPYWRYDFFVGQAPPPVDSFYQIKDEIYWLNISALNIPLPYQWGWKSSRDHFMDDAVYTDNPPDGPWDPLFEPPRANRFDVMFGPEGFPEDLGSTNYYGQGWYRYEYWWNMWFYNNPFVYNPKHIWLEFYVDLPYPHSYAEFAINWSTDLWSLEGEPGRPPLPGDDETLYIGREIFTVVPGFNTIEYWIDDYNPEWVSIDFVAVDAMINGWIWHECVPTSMDLAFVITGHDGPEEEESLYWKPPYDDYAPNGMPDIDQKQDNWFKQTTGEYSFCGPVAVANCFKWFDAKYNQDNPGTPCDCADEFPLVRDYTDNLPAIWCPLPWDDHSPENMDHPATPWLFGATPPPPPTSQPFTPGAQPCPNTAMPPWGELVERLAYYFNTDGVQSGYCQFSGTKVSDMQAGIDAWFESEMFEDSSTLADTLYERTWQKPTFAWVETLVEKCQDVILLLGFWFEDPPGSGAWFRCGGHYVTVAGVNSDSFLIAISDPYFDNAEAGGRGRVGTGTIIPHSIPHTDPTIHNDEGNVSHDIYDVTTQAISPGGLWELLGYPVSLNPLYCERFHEQNVPPEFVPLSAYWNGVSPVFTEVEYAIEISPWEYPPDCGDCNGDGTVNIADVVCLVSYLFLNGPPPVKMVKADFNHDGVVTVADVVYLITYLFQNGPLPQCYDP